VTKQTWNPCSILSPVPAVLVTVRGKNGEENVLTIGWAGTICTIPAMVSISVRKERYSYELLKESGEFVINLTTEALVRATDYCGVRSGRDEDKFAAMELHKEKASKVQAPLIKESPVNIECQVEQVIELGSHDLFIARVVAVDVDEKVIDEKGRLDLGKAHLIAYAHGSYYSLGKQLGTFGYTVKKAPERKSVKSVKKRTEKEPVKGAMTEPEKKSAKTGVKTARAARSTKKSAK